MFSKTRYGSRYDETVLVIGIDIAKERHVAVAEGPRGVLSKPLSFSNSRDGFEQLAQWMETCKTRFGTAHAVIGMEPTGHYWKALGEWLMDRGDELRFVSPVLTKRAKDMLDGSPLKTDAKDAAVIADLVRQGKSRPQSRQQEVFQELRYLSELRHRIVKERTALFNRLHRVLDILFPELPKLFSSLDQKSALALLDTAPAPQAVLALGLQDLAALLRRSSRGRLGQEKAEAIREAASHSIGCHYGERVLRLDLALLLPRIQELATQQSHIEQRMATTLREIDYADRLLAIPGLGVVTVAVILGELGDLRGYRNARQVLKMAGLNLFEKSSGEHQGRRRISKRGRTLLRQVLYLATIRQFAPGCILHELRKKMGKAPGPKVAVAGMRRLLKAIFAIVRDGSRFEPQRFEPRPSHTSLAA